MPIASASSDIHRTRRENLLTLLREFTAQQLAQGVSAKGIEQAFAEHLALSASRLSQFKSSRNIGDKVAQQVEALGGKEHGWLSAVHNETVSPPGQEAFVAFAVRAWQDGNSNDRRRLMRLAKKRFVAV